MKVFKENKNKTSTKADPAFVICYLDIMCVRSLMLSRDCPLLSFVMQKSSN